MRLGETIGGVRRRWLIAAAAAIVFVAFIAGLAFGLSGADRTMAQEGATDLPYPDLVVTPVIPYPTRDMTKRPIMIEKIIETVPVERWTTRSTAGSSTKPAKGNYLYLPMIDRYYSLPDDVKRVKRIGRGGCAPRFRRM